MHETAKPEEDESVLVEGIVSQFRADNGYWVKEGALCNVPCGDMPNGHYLGPDKELYQLCLEIRALSWKMTELRTTIGTAPQISPEEADRLDLVETDAWNKRNEEYDNFYDIVMPLYENRLWRLASVAPRTLHGLARKANVIETELVGYPDNPSPAASVLRSVFRDIAEMMGENG